MCYLMCVMSHWCVMRVQGIRSGIVERIHWASAYQTWHNSHGLTWVVIVYINVLLDVFDVVCDVVSTGNNIGNEGAKSLSQCLSHLTQLTHLYLSGECVHWCVLLGDVMWCHIDVRDDRQQHWIRGSECTKSVLVTLDTTHIPWLALWACALMCVPWWSEVMCDVTLTCVITANNIGEEGAISLIQCLTHLTKLTFLDLSGEFVQIDELLDACDDVWATDNKIGDVGANALSQCLPQLPLLTRVNLCCEYVH